MRRKLKCGGCFVFDVFAGFGICREGLVLLGERYGWLTLFLFFRVLVVNAYVEVMIIIFVFVFIMC